MTLNTGRTPNVMFLDEVTSNIDPLGVSCIYNMICEIAREKKVFVTTHDQDLLEQLNGCSELKLVMKNGVSFLE
jgi:ABC-type multidrug transport system ATPase subunit